MLAATEAMKIGYGGVTLVSHACGLSRVTITKGIDELSKPALSEERIRRPGGGRKTLTLRDPKLPELLERCVEPLTRGDLDSPLRWTCKSTRTLARELTKLKYPISHEKVAQLLRGMHYNLQNNRKREGGNDHSDRDAQFKHINSQVRLALKRKLAVISVDTKKKDLTGSYDNTGQQWLPEKQLVQVEGHDFQGPEVPRAYPYGIYDLGRNAGFVNVGTNHDTCAFAVASICGWWRSEGCRLYPNAAEILITADGGGSNGSRQRLWKFGLQKFADETGLSISVCHFPPGTSKWNKIEHRLFSFISSNWRGESWWDYETTVNLIAKTNTAKGLKVIWKLDRRKYPTGCKVTDAEMRQVNMRRNKFHGEWNYVIKPKQPSGL